jgi:hypothetical protein
MAQHRRAAAGQYTEIVFAPVKKELEVDNTLFPDRVKHTSSNQRYDNIKWGDRLLAVKWPSHLGFNNGALNDTILPAACQKKSKVVCAQYQVTDCCHKQSH